jgi:hypothetical protein
MLINIGDVADLALGSATAFTGRRVNFTGPD